MAINGGYASNFQTRYPFGSVVILVFEVQQFSGWSSVSEVGFHFGALKWIVTDHDKSILL